MAEDAKRTSTPLWIRLLLIASLAINLAVAGMVIGAISSGGGPGQARDAVREARSTPFIRALDPEDRRGLARDMIRQRDDYRESRDALRARFDALLAALRAEELDQAELQNLLEEQRKALQARNAIGEKVIVERVAQMTLDERRAYADRLEAEVKRRPPPKR